MLEVTPELKKHLQIVQSLEKSCSFSSYNINILGDRELNIPSVIINELNIGHKSINFSVRFVLSPMENFDICTNLFRLQKNDSLFKNKYILTTDEYSLVCNVSGYNDLYKSHKNCYELQCYWNIEYSLDLNSPIKKEVYNRFKLMEIE